MINIIKNIIWTNENLDIEDFRNKIINDFKKNGLDASVLTENDMHGQMYQMNDILLDEIRTKSNIELNNQIIAIIDTELNRQHCSSCKEILSNNIKDCFLNMDCDIITWYINKNNDLCCTTKHENENKNYIFREWKNDVKYRKKEKFLISICDGDITDNDINHYTRSIGDIILQKIEMKGNNMNTKKSDNFSEEIEYIENEHLKKILIDFLDSAVPDYFWSIPASSTGKYHPSFDNTEGGLVKHTKMVCAVAIELLRLEKYKNLDSDCVLAACILHDSFKNGIADCGHTTISHPTIAHDEFKNYVFRHRNCDRDMKRYESIFVMLEYHMGQWGPRQPSIEDIRDYCDYIDIAHMADYIASRKFFDMF